MSPARPVATIIIREQRGEPFYEAKWRHEGRQVKRRIGPAWLERDASGGWRARRGRVPEDAFDERRAHVAGAGLVADYVAGALDREREEHERRVRGVTFREVAREWLHWLEHVKGAKPSTIDNYRYTLREPDVPYKRRKGTSAGHIMATLGDRPAVEVTTREVEAMLSKVSESGVSARTVNHYRAVVSAIYGYGTRPSTFALPANPATGSDKRREPHRGALVYYTPEEVEALARALADGLHRDPKDPVVGEQERAEDRQDAEMVRVASYAGLRLGELRALRWRDVDFAAHALTVARAISAGKELSTKSGRVRRVPLADQAAAALDRLSRRENFTDPDELVFCNVLGRHLDGSAVRRRFKRARNAGRLRPLRFHDLRHTFGSLLAAAGVDLVSIQAAMGHSALATTSRYLHARPATDQAQIFTHAFAPSAPSPEASAAAVG
ncbi:MAG TPA: tyrosine-type recombinase/integrase [Solirubrobacteraceae bacterium]|nr:tyrosine-type recombinase/integrase [Solirubrobacteraceae bacterium]